MPWNQLSRACSRLQVPFASGGPSCHRKAARFDTIKRLGGVHMTKSGEVHLHVKNFPRCAAIKIDEPDFSAIFDQRKKK